MISLRTRWLALLLLAVLLGNVESASGNEMREKIASAAKEIAAQLKKQNHSDVAIGEFTGPPAPSTSAGPMIQQALTEELQKLKVSVKEDAFVFVKGEYFILEKERENEQLTIRLEATIRTKMGNKLDTLSYDIGYKANEDLVKLIAMNADLSKLPNADKQDRNEKLREDLKKKPLHLTNYRVQVRKDSPFAVEIFARPAGAKGLGTPRQPIKEKDLAFVKLQKGEEYLIKIHNRTTYEIAASITIDGVDAFQFYQPPEGRPARFLVKPGTARVIQGWPYGEKVVNAFLVGSFGDSAAARVLKSSAKVGTITVCIHACWEGNKPPPELAGGGVGRDVATGIGRPIEVQTKKVKRTLGPLLEAISIRYKK